MGHVDDYFSQLTSAIEGVDNDAVSAWIDRLARARSEGATIFVCGNGGSAATASHFATDTTLALMWSGLFVQRRFCWVVQWVPEDPWRRV